MHHVQIIFKVRFWKEYLTDGTPEAIPFLHGRNPRNLKQAGSGYVKRALSHADQRRQIRDAVVWRIPRKRKVLQLWEKTQWDLQIT